MATIKDMSFLKPTCSVEDWNSGYENYKRACPPKEETKYCDELSEKEVFYKDKTNKIKDYREALDELQKAKNKNAAKLSQILDCDYKRSSLYNKCVWKQTDPEFSSLKPEVQKSIKDHDDFLVRLNKYEIPQCRSVLAERESIYKKVEQTSNIKAKIEQENILKQRREQEERVVQERKKLKEEEESRIRLLKEAAIMAKKKASEKSQKVEKKVDEPIEKVVIKEDPKVEKRIKDTLKQIRLKVDELNPDKDVIDDDLFYISNFHKYDLKRNKVEKGKSTLKEETKKILREVNSDPLLKNDLNIKKIATLLDEKYWKNDTYWTEQYERDLLSQAVLSLLNKYQISFGRLDLTDLSQNLLTLNLIVYMIIILQLIARPGDEIIDPLDNFISKSVILPRPLTAEEKAETDLVRKEPFITKSNIRSEYIASKGDEVNRLDKNLNNLSNSDQKWFYEKMLNLMRYLEKHPFKDERMKEIPIITQEDIQAIDYNMKNPFYFTTVDNGVLDTMFTSIMNSLSNPKITSMKENEDTVRKVVSLLYAIHILARYYGHGSVYRETNYIFNEEPFIKLSFRMKTKKPSKKDLK